MKKSSGKKLMKKQLKQKKPNKFFKWLKERFSFIMYPTDLKGGFKFNINFKL